MKSPVKLFDLRFALSARPGACAALGVLFLAAGVLGACGPSDPTAEIEDARSRYSAQVVSFSVDQRPETPPVEPPAAVTGGEVDAAAGEAAEDTGEPADPEAATAEPTEPVAVRQDVLLDIVLRFNGHDPLDGLTLDITHADADDQAKGTYRAYIDTSDVHRGPPVQIVHRLEDVPYVEGDGFHAEVRSPVPAAERDQYREFSETGEGS